MTSDNQISLKIEKIEFDAEELVRFLAAWADEIERIFPDFLQEDIEFATIYLLKVNAEPAGLVIYQIKGNELMIEIDYLIKKFRDKGVGKRFFDQMNPKFKASGFDKVVALTYDKVHIDYLTSIGFKPSRKHSARYEFQL
jgi:hypothetical protein